MHASTHSIDEHANLAGTNQFEMLLFRLDADAENSATELYGINVFKVREIVSSPPITPIAGSSPHSLGVVQLRDQVIPVYDLPGIVAKPLPEPAPLMIITEFAGSTQAFTVASVDDIIRLDWSQVVSAEASGTRNSLITSVARLDTDGSRLAQVLDVEAILQMVTPEEKQPEVKPETITRVHLPSDTMVLAADDSFVARALMGKTLEAMGAAYEMVHSGKEAWDRLVALDAAARAQGQTIADKVALVLTDLEMPELDGFALTRNIKQDARFSMLPVVIHSSLSGAATEKHAESVGADGYVTKFATDELARTIQQVLAAHP